MSTVAILLFEMKYYLTRTLIILNSLLYFTIPSISISGHPTNLGHYYGSQATASQSAGAAQQNAPAQQSSYATWADGVLRKYSFDTATGQVSLGGYWPAGAGNAAYFGDPYSARQYGRDVLFGDIFGGIGGGIAAAWQGKPLLMGGNNYSFLPRPTLGGNSGRVIIEPLTGEFPAVTNPKTGETTQTIFDVGGGYGGVKGGSNILSTTIRVGKNGNAVEVLFKNGGKMDINAVRVKEWVPNLHPNAPAGTLNKVKFDNFLPGSKGFKRTPTLGEIDFLNGLFK